MKQNRLFAIGDIHGCFQPLKTLVEDKIGLNKSDTLVLLGDYIDRGPQVKEVIDFIMLLRQQGYRIVTLKGNHEDMMLKTYENKANLRLWFYNGGKTTMKSFGLRAVKNFPPEYIAFFKNLEYYYSEENYLFVHAGFNDSAIHPFADKHTMMWECLDQYSHPELKDKTIIHGHCAITAREFDERLETNPKVIDLDTGCVYHEYPGFGNLTSIELHSRQVFRVKYE